MGDTRQPIKDDEILEPPPSVVKTLKCHFQLFMARSWCQPSVFDEVEALILGVPEEQKSSQFHGLSFRVI